MRRVRCGNVVPVGRVMTEVRAGHIRPRPRPRTRVELHVPAALAGAIALPGLDSPATTLDTRAGIAAIACPVAGAMQYLLTLRSRDRATLARPRQAMEMAERGRVREGRITQGPPCTLAQQPGRRHEARRRPAARREPVEAQLQAAPRLRLRQRREFAFAPRVHIAQEARTQAAAARLRVEMAVAMQRQLVAPFQRHVQTGFHRGRLLGTE
ncbi:conserved hypothetical protein, partial [Ricinus communis]